MQLNIYKCRWCGPKHHHLRVSCILLIIALTLTETSLLEFHFLVHPTVLNVAFISPQR